MPTYVYKFVKTGETIEVQQAFSDDTLTEYTHPRSGKTLDVKKVFQPVGVTFKGSGFFKTDNRGKKSSTSGDSGSDGGSSDSTKSDTKSDTGSSTADSGSKKKSDGDSTSASTAKKPSSDGATKPSTSKPSTATTSS